ncbi:MAG: ATP-binding protein [Sphingomonadales bacterium]
MQQVNNSRYRQMKKIIAFVVIVFAKVTVSRGQDTLELFLNRADIPVAAKVDRLNGMARDLSYVNPLRATDLSYRALQLGQQADYPRGVAYALRGIASSLLTEERLYLCMKNLQRSLQIFRTLDDSTGMAGCYISLGHLYRRLQNRDQELYYHQRAFDFFYRQGIAERVGVTTHNLGETFYNRRDFARATALTQRAIKINDSLRNLTVLSACYRVMGNIKLAQADKAAAAYWYQKTLEISDRLGVGAQKVATVDALSQLANILIAKNQSQQALVELQKALRIVKENRLFNYVQPLYETTIKIQVENGSLQALRQTLADYSKTNTELNILKTEVMFRFMETMLQVDSLEQMSTELQAKNLNQKKLLDEKNSRTRLTAIFLVSLLILSVILAYNVFMLRKANQLLTEQRAMMREQNQQLEELNKLKNKFLSILSHDIKAPLQGLKSYVGILQKGGEQIQRGQLLQFAAELEQQLDITTKMADNLIVWAKLQMKMASTQPQLVVVGDAIKDNIRLYEQMASEKKLIIQYGEVGQTTAWADRDQLNFILRNLIHNAIKYSPPNTSLQVASHNEEGRCIMTVCDNGEGMSQEMLDQLSRYDPMISKTGTAGEEGTGLGLRICLEFAQLNRGELTVNNNPSGQGSCFTLRLPAHQA